MKSMIKYDAYDNGVKSYQVAIAALRRKFLAQQRIIAALRFRSQHER